MDRRDSAQSGMFGFFEVVIADFDIGVETHIDMAN
jgi:hypothetical protein